MSGIGDHEAVAVISQTSLRLNTLIKRKLYKWSRVGVKSLHQAAEDLCSNFLINYSCSTPVSILCRTICFKCLDMVPSRVVTTGKNKPPWINHSIKSLSRRKQRLYNQAGQSGLSGDWSLYRLAKK